MDQNNNFYFIEVNARIQVEHPVTELVTGVDLIREQIRVAAGREAAATRRRTSCSAGCAIECRINAEDPANDFRPSPGTVTTWRPPGGPGVRLDSHVVTGLPRAAELRLDGREAARPPADPRGGLRGHAAGAARVQGRGHPHDDPDPARRSSTRPSSSTARSTPRSSSDADAAEEGMNLRSRRSAQAHYNRRIRVRTTHVLQLVVWDFDGTIVDSSHPCWPSSTASPPSFVTAPSMIRRRRDR